MASLDKEIQVLMLKGERGLSSYEEAVEKEYFSGTLEEWIESFTTPDDYITRNEFKKVTQAQYDELKKNNQLIPNCYYVITNDNTWEITETRITALEQAKTVDEGKIDVLESNVSDNTTDINTLKTNALMSRSLKTSQTADDYVEFVYGLVAFTVDTLDAEENENFILARGKLKVNDVESEVTFILTVGQLNSNQIVFIENNFYELTALYGNGNLSISCLSMSMSVSQSAVVISTTSVSNASFKLTTIQTIQHWN